MTQTPTDDQPGFVAEEPEHCFAWYCLIRPGQTYYLTVEQEVLCADCALDEEVIRVREDLAIEVKCDRLVVRRGKAEVVVLPGEIRHLMNASATERPCLRQPPFWGKPPKGGLPLCQLSGIMSVKQKRCGVTASRAVARPTRPV